MRGSDHYSQGSVSPTCRKEDGAGSASTSKSLRLVAREVLRVGIALVNRWPHYSPYQDQGSRKGCPRHAEETGTEMWRGYPSHPRTLCWRLRTTFNMACHYSVIHGTANHCPRLYRVSIQFMYFIIKLRHPHKWSSISAVWRSTDLHEGRQRRNYVGHALILASLKLHCTVPLNTGLGVHHSPSQDPSSR